MSKPNAVATVDAAIIRAEAIPVADESRTFITTTARPAPSISDVQAEYAIKVRECKELRERNTKLTSLVTLAETNAADAALKIRRLELALTVTTALLGDDEVAQARADWKDAWATAQAAAAITD